MVQRNKIYQRDKIEIAVPNGSQPSTETRRVKRELLDQAQQLPDKLNDYLNNIIRQNKEHDHIESVKSIGKTMIKILIKNINKLSD